ncbi:MAG TPA: DUF4331 family protein [Gemmatimonadales bacterium]|nr:DUF4331 family protein [Gemmatimonadales bacterium]
MTWMTFPRRLGAVMLAVLLAAACSDNTTTTAPTNDRVFNQVQRLGNPLVSEVFLAKRDHAFHGSTAPTIDVAAFTPSIRGFADNVAGRDSSVGKTLAAVLLPDELLVQSDKDPASAGWLTWALANGWGGRKLTDDVVTAGLQAIFGALLDPNNTTPALADDHVDGNDVPFGTSFPYLATAH